MKSKIIINILLAYFIILSIVLVYQVKAKEIAATEPISAEIPLEDKIKKSVILHIDSPFYIINETQSLIDEDITLTPKVIDGKVYLPTRFLANAYGANINFSKNTKELTIRLNNKAIIFYNNKNKIKIIDNTSEETLEIDGHTKFLDNRSYIPLRSFAKAFDKEIFYNNSLIVISNMNDIFDPIEEIDLIESISKHVVSLPALKTQDKLLELIEKAKPLANEPKKILKADSKETEKDLTAPFQVFGKTEIYLKENTVFGYKDGEIIFEILLSNFKDKNFSLKDVLIFEKQLILIYSETAENSSFYAAIYNDKSSKALKINGEFLKASLNDGKLNIVSTQNAKILDENQSYTTPIIDFETNQRAQLNEVRYFPELNGDFYTTVTSIELLNENYPHHTNVFLGGGQNVFFDDFLYFITEKNGFTFIHTLKFSEKSLDYVDRIYFEGKVTEVLETSSEDDENIIQIKAEINGEEKAFQLSQNFDQKLKEINNF